MFRNVADMCLKYMGQYKAKDAMDACPPGSGLPVPSNPDRDYLSYSETDLLSTMYSIKNDISQVVYTLNSLHGNYYVFADFNTLKM